jgi:hypothetical protein
MTSTLRSSELSLLRRLLLLGRRRRSFLELLLGLLPLRLRLELLESLESLGLGLELGSLPRRFLLLSSFLGAGLRLEFRLPLLSEDSLDETLESELDSDGEWWLFFRALCLE